MPTSQINRNMLKCEKNGNVQYHEHNIWRDVDENAFITMRI